MKKVAIVLLPIVLFALNISTNFWKFPSNIPFFSLAISFLLTAVAIPGFLYCVILMRRWGGVKSVMGKGFLFLGVSFLSQSLSSLLNFLFFHNSYFPPVVTVLLGCMNLFWALSAYHFLITTGINQKARTNWKIIIIGTLIIGIAMAAYGKAFTSAPYAEEVFNSVMFLLDFVLILETLSLLLHVKNFNGGILVLPALFLSFGIVFQLIGDLVTVEVFKTELATDTLSSAIYNFSWLLMTLSPTSLLITSQFAQDKNQ